jgi:hypothetical protein
MKILISLLFPLFLLAQAADLPAQQFETFGNYEVHYNALNTHLIPAEVATAYGIKRSSSRALVNVTVLDKSTESSGVPVNARVTCTAVNLLGHKREIDMREITEPEGAIYYIGETQVRNLETYRFTVNIEPENSENFVLNFQQQFYTE